MTKLAVIQTGGKQYLVKPGQSLKIEKLNGKPGENFSFDKVLLTADEKEIKIGAPYIEGARVLAKIEGGGRAKKIKVIKYKAKTRYHKKYGHRQPYTQVVISDF